MRTKRRILSLFLICLMVVPILDLKTKAAEPIFENGQVVGVTQMARISGQGNGSFTVAGASSNGYCTENYKGYWNNNETKYATITEWDNATGRKVLYYGPDAPGYSGPYYGSKGEDLDYCTFACGYLNGAENCKNKTKAKDYINRVSNLPDPLAYGYKAFKADITPDSYQDVVFLGFTQRKGILSVTKVSANPEITNGSSCYSLEGAQYGVYSDSSCMKRVALITFDSNGSAVSVELDAGTYYLKEIVAPKGYALSQKVTPVTVTASQTISVTVSNLPQMDPVKILLGKVDRETNENKPQGSATLCGAQYTVKFYDGQYDMNPAELGEEAVKTWIFETDEDGFSYYDEEFLIAGDELYLSPDGYPSLPIGTLTIEETKAPEGYLINPEIYVRQIISEGNAEMVETYNQPIILEDVLKGRIAIHKHTDNGSTQIETPEPGAEFQVFLKTAESYEQAEERERDILVTNEKGYAITKSLPYGTYTVVQTKGLDGRELVEQFDVFICEDGQIYSYILNNALIQAQIEIVKKDIETKEVIKAAGAGFKIRNTDSGEYIVQHFNYPSPMDIEVFYTDTTGRLILPEVLPYGNYELIEQSAPYGYCLDATPVTFKVDGTMKQVVVEKYDMAQKGTITVEKIGEVFTSAKEENGVWIPIYKTNGLEGAVYEIVAAEAVVTGDGTVRYEKDQVVETITTDKDGKAKTDLLYLGEYEVREIQAPYGMVLDPDVVSVSLVYDEQDVAVTTVSVSATNERQKVEIHLKKALEQDETFGIGLEEEILNVRFGLFAARALEAVDGTVIPKDALLATAHCNKNGIIRFVADLPVGTETYVKEIATDKHYALSDKVYSVTFAYAGQQESQVTIDANNGELIENKIIRGTILGKKLDEDGLALQDALFGLFSESETEFTEENAILTCISDETGFFCFADVPYGRWLIRELRAPSAFVLNEKSYAVTVEEENEEVHIIIENKFITGTVLTTKVDLEDHALKLGGAVFDIYLDVDNDQKFNAEVDSFIGEMSETDFGIYQMKDLRFGSYFLHEKIAPEGYLLDENYYPFIIETDGEIVVVENEEGVGLTNRSIYGELEITKKDISNSKLLSGAGFRIKNAAGNIVQEGYTDENGIARFILRYGVYTYEEFEAPNGYLLDSTPYTFSITEEGQIVRVDMTNELIPRPKTGDVTQTGVWFVIAIATGGIAGFSVFFDRKRRHKIEH